MVPGWQTVVRSDMGVAYDIPKAWTAKPQGLLIGYEWDKNRVVTGGAAVLDEKWCGTDERGLAGVKGGKGAKSLKTEAVNEAYNWAYAKYNKEGRTKLTEAAPRAYTNAQGVRGWIASTRATGMEEVRGRRHLVQLHLPRQGQGGPFLAVDRGQRLRGRDRRRDCGEGARQRPAGRLRP